MAVVMAVSRRDGQVTFRASARTSFRNWKGLTFGIGSPIKRQYSPRRRDHGSTPTAGSSSFVETCARTGGGPVCSGGEIRPWDARVKRPVPGVGLRACWSAAASEPTFAHGIAGVLAFAEEFFICHDRLVWMKSPPVLHVGLIVGDPNHQPGGANGPFLQRKNIRHGLLPRLFPL